MPSLVDRITAFFRRSEPKQAATTETPPPRDVNEIANRFSVENSRRAIVADCRKMYDEDTRAKKAIHNVARDIFAEGVKVVANDATAQRVADELFQRLDLNSKADDFIRLAMRDGDCFVEIAVDGANLIQSLSRKPTLETRRNSNLSDRFPDPTKAYWQTDEMWNLATPSPDAIWYADWQMIHIRFDHDEGSRYGSPMFKSARTAYKRLTEGEYDIALRRKLRSGQKLIHVLEGASPSEIEEYQRLNKQALDNPYAAAMDFFTNRKGGIQALEGDANVEKIGDIVHHQQTYMLASPVPLGLLGYGENLNRDVLDDQRQEYEKTLTEIRSWAVSAFIKPLVEVQWLLLGIFPNNLEYTIESAKEDELNAQTLLQLATAVEAMQRAGFPPQTIAELASKIVPIVDVAQGVAQRTEPQEPTEQQSQDSEESKY